MLCPVRENNSWNREIGRYCGCRFCVLCVCMMFVACVGMMYVCVSCMMPCRCRKFGSSSMLWYGMHAKSVDQLWGRGRCYVCVCVKGRGFCSAVTPLHHKHRLPGSSTPAHL